MAELNAAELWQQALGDLRLQMTQATFDTWLRGSRAAGQDNGTLTIHVSNAYAVDWLSTRLAPLIERTVTRLAGEPLSVEFTIGAPDTSDPAGTSNDDDDTNEVVMEAIREERVAVQNDGQALTWTDFYIKLKVAFRKKALRRLKGAKLSIFICLALHCDRDSIACPGIEAIMRETGYGRATVCSALDELEALALIQKTGKTSRWGTDQYQVRGYAWFGRQPAPALWEER